MNDEVVTGVSMAMEEVERPFSVNWCCCYLNRIAARWKPTDETITMSMDECEATTAWKHQNKMIRIVASAMMMVEVVTVVVVVVAVVVVQMLVTIPQLIVDLSTLVH
jgi:hypothetical protein